MKKVQLQVSSRKEVGSSVAGRLRKQGIVPAVLYGKGKKPYSLQVNRRELEQVLHTKAGENVVPTHADSLEDYRVFSLFRTIRRAQSLVFLSDQQRLILLLFLTRLAVVLFSYLYSNLSTYASTGDCENNELTDSPK
jgi:ribosomal protein L25 (general stress protein Ctc)